MTEPSAEQDDAQIMARLNAGESYAEGTALEAAILAHCRSTGRDIEWRDEHGNVTVFGDVCGEIYGAGGAIVPASIYSGVR